MQAARAVVCSSKRSRARFPSSETACNEMSNAVCGPNIQWRGRSFAASVASDSSKPQRSKKRLTKQERRVMLEAFIDKYRAVNAGKFPTISLIRKEVGGSYYVARNVLQEMEYKCHMSPISKKNENVLEKKTKGILHDFVGKEVSPVSTKSKEVSSSGTIADTTSCDLSSDVRQNLRMEVIDSTKIVDSTSLEGDTSSLHFQVKREPQISTSEQEVSKEKGLNCVTKADHPSSPGMLSHQMKLKSEREMIQPLEEVESSVRDSMASEDPGGLKGDSLLKDGQEANKPEKFQSQSSERALSKEEPPPERSMLWGSLKSLADGIIDFWRRM